MAETGPRFGRKVNAPTLTRKQAAMIDFQQKEEETKDWIGRVIEEKLVGESLHALLGDGTVLCRLVQKMFPGVITRFNPPNSLAFKLRENISKFVQVAERVGVPEAARFQVDDLFEAKNMRLVITTIKTLAEMAEAKNFPIRWRRDAAQEAAPLPAPVDPPNLKQQRQAIELKLTPAQQKRKDVEAIAAASDDGLTPLHVAVCDPELAEVVTTLLKEKASDKEVQTKGKKETPLHLAVQRENESAIAALIAAGASVNAQNVDGDTPLHFAAVRDSVPIAERLIIAKSDVNSANKVGNTPLHAACADGCDAVALKLMEKGANVNAPNADGNTPLHLAAAEANAKLCEALIARGGSKLAENKDGNLPIHFASEKGDHRCIRMLAERGTVRHANKIGNTPLHLATMAGTPAGLQQLIAMGGDVNAKNKENETPLILAAKSDHGGALELLAGSGADINAKRTDGWSALYAAAYNGNEETVSFLCKKGASVDLQNAELWTPLHAAASRGHVDVAKMLVNEFKAKINVMSKQGTTAVYHAAAGNHISTVQYLLGAGANINVGAPGSWRPLHIALFNDLYDMAKVLIEAGADCSAVNKDCKGYTPVHLVVLSKAFVPSVLDALLTHKADLSIMNDNGQTALHLAVYWNKIEVARALTERGASLTTKNSKGRTPLDLACHFGHEEMAQMLAKKLNVPVPKMKASKPSATMVDTPVAPPKPEEYAQKKQ